jgi:hypothetical protein
LCGGLRVPTYFCRSERRHSYLTLALLQLIVLYTYTYTSTLHYTILYTLYIMFLDNQNLEAEVTQLEARLQDARAQLAASEYPSPPSSHPNSWSIKGELEAR